MLMMTPEFRKKLSHALAVSEGRRSVPVTLPQFRAERKKRKANQAYRRRLIDETAAIMRRGEPSVFAFEAFMRHGLRSGLCLRGWSWHDADDLAADIVRSALNQIGARRPTIAQGQPEWAQDGVVLIERERCARCGWQLPEYHRKFCSSRCAGAYHWDLHHRFKAEELEALHDDAP